MMRLSCYNVVVAVQQLLVAWYLLSMAVTFLLGIYYLLLKKNMTKKYHKTDVEKDEEWGSFSWSLKDDEAYVKSMWPDWRLPAGLGQFQLFQTSLILGLIPDRTGKAEFHH